MIRALLFQVIAVLFYTGIFAQETNASFILYAPGTPDTTSVFITGSLPQLGSWHPARVKMEPMGKSLWRVNVRATQGVSVEYKYTLGSWDREAVNSNGEPLRNFSSTLHSENPAIDTVYHWKSGQGKKPNGQVTGTVRYHRAYKGSGLLDRDIVVWLPPGYAPDRRKRYPVLYMQDGQNVFDPATSAFGNDWQVDEAADSMIRNKAIEPMIIVGIYNTQHRNTEYIPTEKGKLYRSFLVRELKPFIDSVYQTKTGRKHNFIGGSSAGGVLAFMMVWEYPKVFSKAICMSPAFRLPGNSPTAWNYVKVVENDKKRKKVFFYIDNGGVALERQLQPGIDEMLMALKKKGYEEKKDYIYVSDPAAQHNEKAWASRFPAALKQILRKH